MLLVADAGNTSTLVGLYDGARLVGTWRTDSDRTRAPEAWGAWLRASVESSGADLGAVKEVAIGSGVPAVGAALAAAARDLLGADPLVVTSTSDHGMPMDVDEPSAVGVDRVLNTIAAWAERPEAAIIVDLGTATTLDVVREGRFVGGAIAPGLPAARAGLAAGAPGLPVIEPSAPDRAIGRNTVEAMQSGLVLGHAAMVDGLVERMQSEAGIPLRVLATGGLAELVAPLSRRIEEVRPHLTLEGLRVAFGRIRP